MTVQQSYQFRRITKPDVDSTWALIEQLKIEQAEMTFTHLENKGEVADWIDNEAQLVYVALDEHQRVVSVVRGKRELMPELAHGVSLTAATHSEIRGHGVVAKLTLWALNEMKEQGVTVARIYVYEDNLSSLKSVEKLGFERTGTVPRLKRNVKTGAYVGDVIFHKFLD